MEPRRECRHLRFQSPTARQGSCKTAALGVEMRGKYLGRNRIIFSLGYERLSGGRLTAKRTVVRQPATAGVLRSGDFHWICACSMTMMLSCSLLPTNSPFASQLHIRKQLVKKKVKKFQIRSQVPLEFQPHPPHTSPRP